ncbi:hypothetical protein [Helicobacter sp.]|uniref:hypothetical protein n=1 Tax=Helicobacter sp. TaxID=218 RepID=UPI0025BDA9A8|nr:hypothetical protein [Helicobacter sp.]MBR2494308.1 hypothetical protein [Helicobacter sp.]
MRPFRLLGARLALLLILAPISLLAIPLCQSQSEQLKFWGGTLMQIISLHAGVGADFNALDSSAKNLARKTATTPIVGASAGVMYMNPEDDRELDYGWRVRYLFSHSPKLDRSTHYIGALLYLHPFPNPYHRASGAIQTHKDCEDKPDGYPTPFSFVLGSGLSVQSNPYGQSVGGYMESGIALFKWFPLNAELIYRISFYPSNPYFESITQSIQLVFTIL